MARTTRIMKTGGNNRMSKNQGRGEPVEKNTGKAEKVILIKGADKSALGPDSVITNKASELAWNKKKGKK